MKRNWIEQQKTKGFAGFTLIELVVVITILAILSAAALPRFVSLQQDARIAKLDGIAGSLRSAAALAHAACLTRSSTGSISCPASNGPAATVVALMEGADISLVNQYPAATDIGIDRAANADLANNRLTAAPAPPTGSGPNGRTFMVDGATNPATCAATYIEAVGSAAGQVTVPATVNIVSSGC